MSLDRRALRLPAHVGAVLGGAGQALAPATRGDMERRFGRSLAEVRVHTGAAAAQSARALHARAYTVGPHIVFGPEGYAPERPEGRARLAHELAHVVQHNRSGGVPLSATRREAEARQAARSIAHGTPMPALSAATPALSRDGEPGTEDDDAAFEATLAEGRCDIGTLCRLSARAPTAVGRDRVLRAWQACHPRAPVARLVAGNPCLTPDFGLPPRVPAAGPRRATGTAPGATPAPAGGGLSLPSTTIAFNLGPAAVSIDLPASLSARLPVPFRGAQRVVFALDASPTGFSFSVTVNAARHVRIIARASATTEGEGRAGLTIQTTRTTCQAVDPAAARSALQSAGTRLRDAIAAVQNPPAPDPEASELERSFAPHARLAEVVGAVANLKSEIDRVGAPCREVPVLSAEFGVQGPLTTPEPAAGERPPASFIGGSLRLHF